MKQKRTCMKCGKPAKKNHVTIEVDGERHYICEACMQQNRAEMLSDPNHPAWQYYNVVAAALMGSVRKVKTDD